MDDDNKWVICDTCAQMSLILKAGDPCLRKYDDKVCQGTMKELIDET